MIEITNRIFSLAVIDHPIRHHRKNKTVKNFTNEWTSTASFSSSFSTVGVALSKTEDENRLTTSSSPTAAKESIRDIPRPNQKVNPIYPLIFEENQSESRFVKRESQFTRHNITVESPENDGQRSVQLHFNG